MDVVPEGGASCKLVGLVQVLSFCVLKEQGLHPTIHLKQDSLNYSLQHDKEVVRSAQKRALGSHFCCPLSQQAQHPAIWVEAAARCEFLSRLDGQIRGCGVDWKVPCLDHFSRCQNQPADHSLAALI